MLSYSISLQIALSVIVAGLTWTGTAMAKPGDPIWLETLKIQISRQEACEASHFLNVQEYELGGSKVYEARVQCADGRQFDASRTGDNSEFTILSCGPVKC